MKQDGVFKKVKSHSGGLELFFICNPSKVPDFRGGGWLLDDVGKVWNSERL